VSSGGGFSSIDVSNDDEVNVSLFFTHFVVVCLKSWIKYLVRMDE
jgi:hypothetical protein